MTESIRTTEPPEHPGDDLIEMNQVEGSLTLQHRSMAEGWVQTEDFVDLDNCV